MLTATKALVSALVVAGMVVCIYAIAINGAAGLFLAPILGPYIVMGIIILILTWRPPAICGQLARGEVGWNEARGWGAFWYGAFAHVAACVVILAVVGAGVFATQLIGLPSILVWPASVIALAFVIRLTAKLRDLWFASA